MPAVDVWIVPLDIEQGWLAPTAEESERAQRLVSEPLRRRYLRSHSALRAILARYTSAELVFASAEFGKPYLPGDPQLQFNLSHSHDLALVAVAHGVEVGVDVERYRPLAECMTIAERFFPPADAAALGEVETPGREREFFRRWTTIEARLKARGTGLYGAGREFEGEWSVAPVDAGADYAASVAIPEAEMSVKTTLFRPTE